MNIKSIKGTRSEIFVEIDDKMLIIQGELTMTPEFYADGIKFRGYTRDELLFLRGESFKVLDVSFKNGIYDIILIHL